MAGRMVPGHPKETPNCCKIKVKAHGELRKLVQTSDINGWAHGPRPPPQKTEKLENKVKLNGN